MLGDGDGETLSRGSAHQCCRAFNLPSWDVPLVLVTFVAVRVRLGIVRWQQFYAVVIQPSKQNIVPFLLRRSRHFLLRMRAPSCLRTSLNQLYMVVVLILCSCV